jgi:hypothetical protein
MPDNTHRASKVFSHNLGVSSLMVTLREQQEMLSKCSYPKLRRKEFVLAPKPPHHSRIPRKNVVKRRRNAV